MDIPGLQKLPHVVLAVGEATGHHHSAITPSASLWGGDGGVLVLDAPEDTTIVHQEHGPVTVPARVGGYSVEQVLEFHHFDEEARTVVD